LVVFAALEGQRSVLLRLSPTALVGDLQEAAVAALGVSLPLSQIRFSIGAPAEKDETGAPTFTTGTTSLTDPAQSLSDTQVENKTIVLQLQLFGKLHATLSMLSSCRFTFRPCPLQFDRRPAAFPFRRAKLFPRRFGAQWAPWRSNLR
jgi:hypothetical protein